MFIFSVFVVHCHGTYDRVLITSETPVIRC